MRKQKRREVKSQAWGHTAGIAEAGAPAIQCVSAYNPPCAGESQFKHSASSEG